MAATMTSQPYIAQPAKFAQPQPVHAVVRGMHATGVTGHMLEHRAATRDPMAAAVVPTHAPVRMMHVAAVHVATTVESPMAVAAPMPMVRTPAGHSGPP